MLNGPVKFECISMLPIIVHYDVNVNSIVTESWWKQRCGSNW